MKKETVNIFMSCDDGYVPFLAVALASIKKNRDESRPYKITVLYTNIKEENRIRTTEFYSEEGFTVDFLDISNDIKDAFPALHTRDYYSKSTYYRIFIPRLFNDIDKALYLDCDIVANADVASMYDTPLGNNLLAAIPDAAVQTNETFALYTQERLGIEKNCYVNAGIILMNLSLMRKIDFEGAFLALLDKVKFDVAQDQDYLNALCYGKIVYLDSEWNVMPTLSAPTGRRPKIVHYNLDNKPWKKDNVPYADFFFNHAKDSAFCREVLETSKEKTPEYTKRAEEQTLALIRLAMSEAMDKKENERIKKEISLSKGKMLLYEKN